jgi:hypothetical protein
MNGRSDHQANLSKHHLAKPRVSTRDSFARYPWVLSPSDLINLAGSS